MWYTLLGLVSAYLLGSISFAVWVGRIFYHTDVRKQGSGNAGTTNTIRVLGWGPGLAVLLLDAFKGWLAIFISQTLIEKVGLVCLFGHLGEVDPCSYCSDGFLVLTAVCVLLGHIFPLYTGFKGGKGVATMVGIALALYPNAILVAFAVFLLIFFCTHYVSLASMVGSIVFPIADLLVFHLHEHHPVLITFSILVPVLIITTHRKNIVRLIKGEESKLYLKKR